MTGTYHIWPLTLGLLFAYLLSIAGIRMGLYTKTSQRKFWNVILLLVFLSAASLGLFFAFQINYKIDFKAEDLWMLIHVDSGIALATISVFHFTWHVRYYLGMVKPHKKGKVVKPEDEEVIISGASDTVPGLPDRIPVYLLGVTTLITQVVLLRAFMNVFEGNELVIGVILGTWMLLTGLGAWFGKKVVQLRDSIRFVYSNLLWLGILPLLTIFALYFFKTRIFLPGSMVGVFAVILFSLVLLIPFCILSGYSFSLYATLLSRKAKANLTGRVYGWEATGSLAGGLLLSFFLIFIFKSVQILSLVFLLNLWGAWYWGKTTHIKTGSSIFIAAGIVGGIVLLLLPADRYLQQFLYQNQKIHQYTETPVGSFVVTQNGDQYNLFENGIPVATTLDPVANEEDVHYAMLQRPDPREVLLVSGGVTGMISEILKYPVKNIDYVELNPWMIKAGNAITADIQRPEVNIIRKDPRRYIQTCKKKYDVVLFHLPAPSTAQLNRFYTLELFKKVRDIMGPDGVLCFGIPYAQNYPGRQGMELTSLFYSTLDSVFQNILIVPGEKSYFLASDKSLSLNITQLVAERHIDNDYVSPYYLNDDLLAARNSQIMQALHPVRRLNTDLNPVAYFRQISLWLSYYRFDTRIFAVVLGLLFLWMMIRSGKTELGVFAGGFAATAVEILLLFVFQVLYGNVYLMISGFVSLFMAGLALGAIVAQRTGNETDRSRFSATLLVLTLLVLAAPVYLIFSSLMMRLAFIPGMLILGHVFTVAFLTGRLFYYGSLLQTGNVARKASALYAADLTGGALGAMTMSVLLLPLAGVAGSSLMTAAFCFLVYLFLLPGKKLRTGS